MRENDSNNSKLNKVPQLDDLVDKCKSLQIEYGLFLIKKELPVGVSLEEFLIKKRASIYRKFFP